MPPSYDARSADGRLDELLLPKIGVAEGHILGAVIGVQDMSGAWFNRPPVIQLLALVRPVDDGLAGFRVGAANACRMILSRTALYPRRLDDTCGRAPLVLM